MEIRQKPIGCGRDFCSQLCVLGLVGIFSPKRTHFTFTFISLVPSLQKQTKHPFIECNSEWKCVGFSLLLQRSILLTPFTIEFHTTFDRMLCSYIFSWISNEASTHASLPIVSLNSSMISCSQFFSQFDFDQVIIL